MENSDVKDYLFHLVEEKEVSTSTLNTAINALKFYYGEVLKKRFADKETEEGQETSCCSESGGGFKDSIFRYKSQAQANSDAHVFCRFESWRSCKAKG